MAKEPRTGANELKCIMIIWCNVRVSVSSTARRYSAAEIKRVRKVGVLSNKGTELD
jgi:hypothetical protein